MTTLLDNLSAVRGGGSPEERARAFEAVQALAKSSPQVLSRQPLDPNHLPMNRAKTQARKPGETPEAFQARFKDLKVDVKAARQPPARAAAKVAPQPADLQPTEDVQITAEVRGLAFELGNSPVAIYNWVHDNVEFVPTYGSIQGSRITLLTKRGNAFDIASLLIALLRASNVPARYVFGTAQVPVDKLANWLGGTESPAVSQQLLGQGGIPNVGLLQNGQLTHVRMEHVWVEAWVSFIPGRGAKPGPGDTWVPLDGSFKQHVLTPQNGVIAGVPFDVQAFSNALLQGSQLDPQLGRVVGINPSSPFTALQDFQEQQQAYAQSHNLAFTQDAVLGKEAIIASGAKVLPASLPYTLVVRASAPSVLPASLRLAVTLNGFGSILDQALGTPSYTYSISLPALNSRRLGITYQPATDADAQTLQTLRSGNASSLPVYLVNVKPVITVDGAAVATGSAVGMGGTQPLDVVLQEPDGSETISYQLVAGDESVVGLNGNGMAPEVVQARFNEVPPSTAAENLQQVAMHYWMETDFLDGLAAAGLKVHALRRLSVGLFSSPLSVSYLFGTPRSGIYQSRIMDVKRSLVGVAGETAERTRAFVRASGQMGSYLEGSVFDQLFGRPLGRGISAMQLLYDAALGNIPIYTVTRDNVAAVMPLLRVPQAVKTDVANAINAGKTVVIPESDFLHDNYRGVGYIVEDPETGAAAYLISGGLNGGGLLDCLPDLVPIVVFIVVIVLLLALLWWLLPAIAAALAAAAAALAPELAALAALFAALFISTGPAYAAGGYSTGGQADPCNCPPCPTPPGCVVDTTHGHGPCPADHWHYFVYNQGPAPACTCYLQRLFGTCIPPPLPVPCPP